MASTDKTPQRRVRLVLSCGMERYVDELTADAYGIKDGDSGWCDKHEEATVDAMFVEVVERVG